MQSGKIQRVTPGRLNYMKQQKEKSKKLHSHYGLQLSLPAFLVGLAGTLAAAYLFYGKPFGLLPGAFAGLYIACMVQKEVERKRMERRREAFKRLLLSMETALEAGYSLENSVAAAVGDLQKIFGGSGALPIWRGSGERKGKIGSNDISSLFGEMLHGIELRVPVWQVMQDFAEKTGLSEAEELAQVLRIQQRAGGNLIRTMRSTVDKLRAGLEVQQEIEAVTAEKRLEQRIMTLMPALIICYLRLTNGAYIAPLYTTAAGAVVMTAALGLNIAGAELGKRLVG